MNSIIKYVIAGVALYLVGKTVGFLWSFILLLLIIAIMLWTKRAVLLTRKASQAYFIGGDAEKGEKYYEKAYKTGEMTPDCKISYSSFCLRENKFERGKKLLNEVINSRFSSPENKLSAKHNMAVLIWHEGDLDAAIELMEEVHAKVPATNTYGTLGVLYLEKAKQGDAEKALPFMEEAYEYNDSDKTIADNLGELYYILGEYDKAKEVYEKLMKQTFQTPVPYYNYGRVLKALGDRDGAEDNFNKALRCRFTSVMTITQEDVSNELSSLKKRF